MVLRGQRLEEHSDPGVAGGQGVCGEAADRIAKAEMGNWGWSCRWEKSIGVG